MENKVLGIHHITAIAGNAQVNYDFYTRVLGLRLVKKTVNFDDPGTYHFYFGDEVGTPGTILTFFPWENVRQGKLGTGMTSEIGYSAPEGSLDFWIDRFTKNKVTFKKSSSRFGEQVLTFTDPDGLNLSLIISVNGDARKPWITGEVNSSVALKGFHSATIMLKNVKPTARVLTEVLDYSFIGQEGNRFRYKSNTVDHAAIIDLLEMPDESSAINAGGTVHHIAFRVKDEETLMKYRQQVLDFGLNITPKVDRNYFFSLYFREPGGVLFEIATDNPGFAVDEPVNELGKNLKLPPQYESSRAQIEKVLPELTVI